MSDLQTLGLALAGAAAFMVFDFVRFIVRERKHERFCRELRIERESRERERIERLKQLKGSRQ